MGAAIFLKIGRLGGLLWRSLLPIGEKWLLLHRVGGCLRKAGGPCGASFSLSQMGRRRLLRSCHGTKAKEEMEKKQGEQYMEYMSQEGYDELVAELRQLETVELPKVRDAIAEARDKGDLSENFEYRAAKREQWRLLGRIRFKQKVLEHARVIDKSRLQADCVGLLSKVSITNLGNNRSMTYTIVSPHEMNLREGKISIKSPVGQALLGKRKGDEVTVRVPAGLLKLRIENVEL